mmetsp:Transcript_75893/g.210638  ORF Transcript_75893/g.210638 Transcript_75893/m.210638 type:complete len:108 (+) Transcript_75893:167-490(+)
MSLSRFSVAFFFVLALVELVMGLPISKGLFHIGAMHLADAPKVDRASAVLDAYVTNDIAIWQDMRLLASFILGIAFVHALELMRFGRPCEHAETVPQRKFEMYPFAL